MKVTREFRNSLIINHQKVISNYVTYGSGETINGIMTPSSFKRRVYKQFKNGNYAFVHYLDEVSRNKILHQNILNSDKKSDLKITNEKKLAKPKIKLPK